MYVIFYENQKSVYSLCLLTINWQIDMFNDTWAIRLRNTYVEYKTIDDLIQYDTRRVLITKQNKNHVLDIADVRPAHLSTIESIITLDRDALLYYVHS